MKRIGRIALMGLAIVLVASAAFAFGWHRGRYYQIVQSGLSESMTALALLGYLDAGEKPKAVHLLDLTLDGDAAIAWVALSDSLLPSSDKRFAECVLAKIKKHREAIPSRVPDGDSAGFRASILSRDFQCTKAEA